jgi:hypothetical protein
VEVEGPRAEHRRRGRRPAVLAGKRAEKRGGTGRGLGACRWPRWALVRLESRGGAGGEREGLQGDDDRRRVAAAVASRSSLLRQAREVGEPAMSWPDDGPLRDLDRARRQPCRSALVSSLTLLGHLLELPFWCPLLAGLGESH